MKTVPQHVPLLKPIKPTGCSDIYHNNLNYHNRSMAPDNIQVRTLRLAEQGVPLGEIAKQLLIPESHVFKTLCKIFYYFIITVDSL